jgi:hypothetical protein
VRHEVSTKGNEKSPSATTKIIGIWVVVVAVSAKGPSIENGWIGG